MGRTFSMIGTPHYMAPEVSHCLRFMRVGVSSIMLSIVTDCLVAETGFALAHAEHMLGARAFSVWLQHYMYMLCENRAH